MSRRLIITGMSGLVAVTLLAASPTAAESVTDSIKKVPTGIHIAHQMHQKNMVGGAVASVSGSTLTLNEKHASTTIAYTIDASAATVYKSGATSTVSEIQVGDKLLVKGTITGTNVAATTIFNGVAGGFAAFGGKFDRASSTAAISAGALQHKPFARNASSTEDFKGNFTFGDITAVDGSSFTISDKGRKDVATTTYSVVTDGSTVFKKAGQSASLSDVTVGQFVMVAGAKNSANDTITATSVNVVTKMSGEGRHIRKKTTTATTTQN